MKTKLLALSLLIFSSLSVAGCNKDTSSQTSEVKKDFEVYLNETSVKLIIGDKTKLVASNSLEDSSLSVKWSTSNRNIAIVDNDGNVEAISAGEATISATINGVKAQCLVTVGTDFYVPTLDFINDISSEEQIAKNTSINLNTYVTFNNKKFYDMDVIYSVTNPSAGYVDEGIFYAGSQIGASTDVIISASWRGFDSPSLTKRIKLNVISFKNIYLNEGELSDIELYTISEINGTKYKVSQEITSIKGDEDGVEKDITSVRLINNKSTNNPSLEAVKLDWNSSTKTGAVTAIAAGSATLEAKFIDSNNEEYVKCFLVTVDLPIYDINEVTKNFSIVDGKFYDAANDKLESLSSLFIAGSKTIVKAYQGEEELRTDGSAVFGVSSNSNNSFGTADLVIYNDVMAIKCTVEAAQKVITTVKDFESIYAASVPGTTVDGYYVVAKDIENKSTRLSMPSGMSPTTFAGIFDGNGHKITLYLNHSNALDEWGLFGNSFKGTIKNAAFTNCEMGAAFAGLIAHHCETGATLSNVYINNKVHSTASTASFATFYSTYGSLKATQVIINVPDVMTSNGNHGAFGIHKLANGSKDLYIVTPHSYGIGETDRFKSYIYQQQADADVDFTGTKHVLYPAALWYPRFIEMDQAHNDYSAFDSNLWDITSGVPVFKGLSYYTK
ncbi:MAG: Ig-like domain-containing protein [Bacilli bacterium]|nr:Ig-like domain-containing protein [Bacilli bacterium]